MVPSKIKIESFAKRYHMGTLGGKGLTSGAEFNWTFILWILFHVDFRDITKDGLLSSTDS